MPVTPVGVGQGFNKEAQETRTELVPTCPVPDGQVVSLLQDDVQLVHCWKRRLELCITGSNNIDAL